MTVSPLRSAFHTTGLLYYPWIVLGAAAVVMLGLVSIRFLRSLPRRTRRTLVFAAIVFLTGALGGMYAETHGRRNLAYGGITTIEETLEMLGVAIAAFGRRVPARSRRPSARQLQGVAEYRCQPALTAARSRRAGSPCRSPRRRRAGW
jgi:hypothetical protein